MDRSPAGRRPAPGDRRHDHRAPTPSARRTASSTSAPSIRSPSSTLTIALEQAREAGLLGENILGTGLRLRHRDPQGRRRVRLRRGDRADRLARRPARHAAPAAAVPRCRRAIRASRPTSTTSRPWPTCPLIVLKGSDWYRGIGTEGSKGTKIFALAGKVNNTGLVEVPMGATLRADHLRHRRRHPERTAVQGRADGRAVRRLRPGAVPGPADRLRLGQASRRDHGLRRPDRDGRGHLHGGHRPLLPGVRPEANPAASACRAAIGTRHMLDILTRISAGRGRDGGHRPARAGWARTIKRGLALRPGPDRAEPGAVDASATSATSTRSTSVEKRCRGRSCEALVAAPLRRTPARPA